MITLEPMKSFHEVRKWLRVLQSCESSNKRVEKIFKHPLDLEIAKLDDFSRVTCGAGMVSMNHIA